MYVESLKYSFILIFTLVITPFILFLGNNFLQTEFFTLQYFLVSFFYCSCFMIFSFGLFFFSKKTLLIIFFFSYLSFLQFYFFDMQQLLKTYKDGSSGKEVLFFIILLSFIAAILSRSLIFKKFVLILLFLNILLSVYYLVPTANKYLFTLFNTSNVDNYSSKIINSKSIKHPNIFYIIPDGLASPKILNEYVNIDFNESIINFENKGFSIQKHNYSSYNMTRWSLAALFIMDYPGTENTINSPHYPTIRENNPAIMQYLKKNNYKFVIVPPYWGGCPINKDYNCLTPSNNSYTSFFFQDYAVKTIFRYSLIKIALERLNKRFNVSINYDLDDAGKTTLIKLKENSKIWSDGGVFTMIHMMMPHTPYREENCLITDRYISPSKDGYRSTVLCTLSRIHELSDYIIKNYPNATIVIQSDHGVDPITIPDNQKFEDILELSIDYKLSNFTAVRGCNSKQAAKLNQANIIEHVVECLVNEISVPRLQNKSFWGFYPNAPEYGKFFPVNLKSQH